VVTAQALAQHFNLDAGKVKCITHHMGGGYGSKFGPDVQGITAAELAKKAGKPVKLMLDREEEITTAGNRTSAYGTVKIAGTKDGKITAFEIDCYGSPGISGGPTVNLDILPYPYGTAPVIANIKRKHSVVRLNTGGARAMRAPNHPQSCMLSETAVDDLAAKLDLDPVQVRLKNLPPGDPNSKDPISWNALRNKIYTDEIDIAMKLSGWKQKWHPPGKGPDKGVLKRGIGMALHTWGGNAAGPNECKITISRSGSVSAESSTQDLGTGQRTVTAVVTAEILGLEPAGIHVKIGEGQLANSSGSGGSRTR